MIGDVANSPAESEHFVSSRMIPSAETMARFALVLFSAI